MNLLIGFVLAVAFAEAALGQSKCNFADLNTTFEQTTGKWIPVGKWQFSRGQPRNTTASGPLLPYGRSFVMVRGGSSLNQQPATLTSLDIPLLKNDSCLEFYYYVFGLDAGQLTVQVLQGANVASEDRWKRTGSYFDKWHQGLISFNSRSTTFSLRFTLTPGSGTIALGVIRPLLGLCKMARPVCDFESNDFCSWDITTAGYRFNLLQAKNVKAIGNLMDHSTMTGEGYVAVPVAAEAADIGDTANLFSPSVAANNGNYCLTFWHYQLDNGQANPVVDKIEVFIRQAVPMKERLIWSSANKVTRQWNRVKVTVPFRNYQNGYVVIKATKVTSDASVAVDDLSLEPHNCKPKFDCDFNSDMCGFTHDPKSPTKKWLVGFGRVGNASQLPFKSLLPDQSNSPLGMYAYTDFTGIKTSTGMSIRSELMDPVSGGCVSFWYLVRYFGNKTDPKSYFFVELLDEGTTNPYTKWTYDAASDPNSKVGFDKQQWQQAFVPISANYNHRIRFSALSYVPQTFIGIDDVAYSTKPCSAIKPTTPLKAQPTTKLPTAAPKTSVDCDFESNNFCNWRNNNQSSWKINSPAIHTPDMPVVDHTKQNLNGRYAFVGSPPAKFLPVGAVMSINDTLTGYNGPVCLRFWHYLKSDDPLSHLSVTVTQNRVVDGIARQMVTTWARQGDQGEQWLLGTVDYVKNNSAALQAIDNIQIVGVVSAGAIAIDDIKLIYKSCKDLLVNEFSCSFENTVSNNQLCGFANRLPLRNWKWFNGSSTQIKVVDHTLKTRSGHFVGVEVKNKSEASVYQIVSDWQPSVKAACVSFSYLIIGEESSNLKFFIRNENDKDFTNLWLWEANGDQGSFWLTQRITVSRPLPWMMMFGASTDINKKPSILIAIDDVTVDRLGACPPNEKCNFENGACTWEKVPLGVITAGDKLKNNWNDLRPGQFTSTVFQATDFLWTVHSPSLGNDPSLPTKDHTIGTKSGSYLLMRNSPLRKPSDQATMMSHRIFIQQNQTQCLTFSYFITPSRVTATTPVTLSVVQSESASKKSIKVAKYLNQTSDWITVNLDLIPINSTSKNIFVYFVGSVAASPNQGHIALDDISVVPGACVKNNNTFRCSNGKIIDNSKVCDFIQDCPNNEDEANCGNCGFENGVCGYTNQTFINQKPSQDVKDLRWFPGRPNLPPKMGAANTVGFVVALGNKFNEAVAKLYTPQLKVASEDCNFNVYYHRFSTNVTLTVSLETAVSEVILWDSSCHLNRKENAWNGPIRVQLQRMKVPFKVVFRAQNVISSTNVLALDEVKFFDCGPPRTVDTCPQGFMRCRNSYCVSNELKCDLADNCGDNTDEEGCDRFKRCDFENGMCEWGTRVNVGWLVRNVNYVLKAGPTRDHTKGLSSGKYLFASGSYPQQTTKTISGPIFMANKNCKMRLFYNIEGVFTNDSHFGVYIQNAKTGVINVTKVIRQPLNRFGFVRDQINFDRYTSSYKSGESFELHLVTVLKPNNDFTPYVAVDDISFTPECQPPASPPSTMPTAPPTTSLPPGIVKKCIDSNGKVIFLPKNRICDFIYDCKDGSDERDCGPCDFSTGYCGWTNTAEFKWKRMQASQFSNKSFSNIPKKDSNNNPNGYFLIVDTSQFTHENRPAVLMSPEIGKTSVTCQMSFKYHATMSPKLSPYLKIDFHIPDPTNPSKKIIKNHWLHTNMGTAWQEITVDAPNLKTGTQIGIKAYNMTVQAGNNPYADVEIDKIKFINCNNTQPQPVNKNLTCAFEDNLCGWFDFDLPNQDDPLDWTITSPGQNPMPDPGFDHTSLLRPRPAKFGRFAYTKIIPSLSGNESATLMSIGSLPAGKAKCLTFWYHLFGEDDAYLALKVNSNQSPVGADTRWLKKMPQSNNWVMAQVTLGPRMNLPYYVMFVAQLAKNSRDTIGLDDIELTDGQCPWEGTCDFELRECSWISNDGEWSLATGREAKNPLIDHTTGTDNGGYALLTIYPNMISSGTFYYKISRRLTPLPNVPEKVCLRLWMYLSATAPNDKIVVSHKPRNSATSNELVSFKISDFIQNQWIFRSQAATVYMNDQLSIYAYSDHANTIIALDDLSITPGLCEPKGQCNFESDFCGFYNAPQQPGIKRVLWLRTQGFLRSNRLTGPTDDHTTGGPLGWFLFVPLNPLTTATAILKSPTFNGTIVVPQTYCIRFYYHISSTDKNFVPSLMVSWETYFRNGQERTVPIGLINGTQIRTSIWNQFNQTIQTTGSFRIVLSTIKQQQAKSDIAIDDVAFYKGNCYLNGPTTKSPPTTPRPTLKPVDTYNCNFDIKNCSWTGQNDGSWTVKSYTPKKIPTGPKQDKSWANSTGKYLQFTANAGSKGVNGKFNYQSPVIKEITRDDHCFTFWYFADLPSSNSWIVFIVNVMPENNQQNVTSIFKLPIDVIGLNSQLWKRIDVKIPKDIVGVKLVLQASRYNIDSMFLGNFALDDLRVNPGPCDTRTGHLCTFENGFCGYGISRTAKSTDDVADGNWVRNLGFPGPTFDHTTNTASGKYYLFAHKPSATDQSVFKRYKTQIIIPDLPSTSWYGECVQFWYQNYAPNMSNPGQILSVYLATSSSSKRLVWNTTFPVHRQWSLAQINIRKGSRHQIIIEFDKVFSASNIGSYIAIDDVSARDYNCAFFGRNVDCSFENECRWSNDFVGQPLPLTSRWSVMTVPPDSTWANFPGPYMDHTFRSSMSGSYIYFNTYSNAWFKGINTSIYSQPVVLSPNGDYCFIFYAVFLQGNNSFVNLEMVMNSPTFPNGNKSQVMGVIKPKYNTFKVDKSKYNSWKRHQVTIVGPALSGVVEATFRIRGFLESASSFIAIDDISLVDIPCNDDSLINVCGDGTLLNRNQICNFVPDCPGKTIENSPDEINCGQCDFETDMCFWTNYQYYGSSQWVRRNAAMGNSKTPLGPTVDSQGKRNGTYLILEKKTTSSRGFGAIRSSSGSHIIKQASYGCQMTFDYFMNSNDVIPPGRDPIELAVTTREYEEESPLWRMVGNQGPKWNKATVHIDQEEEFFISITGYYPNNNSTLAIDNIKFINCGPPKAKPIGYCKPEEIQCPDTKACRLQNTECDGVFDCSGNQNSSDEKKCSRLLSKICDFERKSWNKTCQLNFPKPTGVTSQWKVVDSDLYARRNRFRPTGPMSDHTFGQTGSGFFLLLTMANRADAGKSISFMTTNYIAAPPKPGGNLTNCAIRFWYYMYGNSSQNGKLNLYADFPRQGLPTVRWQLLSEPIRITNMQRWVRFVVPVKSQRPFKFVFEATIGNDNQSDIAIDDISYSNCSVFNGQLPTGIPTMSTPRPTSRPDQLLDCDFKRDTCSWTQNSNYWVVKSFNASSRFPGPHVDSYGRMNMKYLQVFPKKQLVFDSLILQSPIIEASVRQSHCFSFWHNILSFYRFNLTIRAKSDGDNPTKIDLMRVPVSRRGAWTEARVDVPRTSKKIRLLFIFQLLENITNDPFDVAFDNFEFTNFSCPPLPGIECTFEEGLCPRYSVIEQKSPNPGIKIGSVKSATTRGASPGPNKDHSLLTVNGNYFLFSNQPTDPAGFYSSTMLIQNIASHRYYYSCLKFYYQSWSNLLNSTQSLNISVQANGAITNNRLFEVPLYANWTLRMVQISPKSTPFSVWLNFTKTHSTSERGYIAIDDVSLSNQRCRYNQIECPFLYDMCGWMSTPGQPGPRSGVKEWYLLNRRQNLTNWPGPLYKQGYWDVSRGSYVYLYDRTSQVPIRASLLSSPITISTTFCFNFYYVFVGPNLGSEATNSTITVEALLRDRRIPTGQRTKLLATIKSGNISTENRSPLIWKNRFFKTIKPSDLMGAKEVVLRITGNVNNNKTILAIDGISFRNSVCPPNNEKFLCDDRATEIPMRKVCNFVSDCPLTSPGLSADERNCGNNCGFEAGTCSWTGVGKGSWSIRTGQQNSFPTGPSVDGSNAPFGSYLMVVPPKRGDNQFLTSFASPGDEVSFKNTTYKCTMTFNYWIKNNDQTPPTDPSRIWVVVNGEYFQNTTTWRTSGPTGDNWAFANVSIGQTNREFQVTIQTWYTGVDTAIAIDNINFVDCEPHKPASTCQSGQLQCADTKVCINQFATCDGVNDCNLGKDEYYRPWDEDGLRCGNIPLCHFDNSDWNFYCNLTFIIDNKSVTNSKWKVIPSGNQNGSLADLNRKTGPMADYTNADDRFGQYLTLFQSAPSDAGKSLFFWSRPLITKPNQQCAIRFFYYMFGNVNQPAQLNVYTQTSTITQRVFSASTSNDQRWIRAMVPGPTGQQQFRFLFEGRISQGNQSDIAIDDISYSIGCDVFNGVVPTAIPTGLPTGFPTSKTNPTLSTSSRVTVTSQPTLSSRSTGPSKSFSTTTSGTNTKRTTATRRTKATTNGRSSETTDFDYITEQPPDTTPKTQGGSKGVKVGTIIAVTVIPILVLALAGAAGWWYVTKFRNSSEEDRMRLTVTNPAYNSPANTSHINDASKYEDIELKDKK